MPHDTRRANFVPYQELVDYKNLFNCLVCVNPLTTPRMLDCQHVFCDECLRSYATLYTRSRDQSAVNLFLLSQQPASSLSLTTDAQITQKTNVDQFINGHTSNENNFKVQCPTCRNETSLDCQELSSNETVKADMRLRMRKLSRVSDVSRKCDVCFLSRTSVGKNCNNNNINSNNSVRRISVHCEGRGEDDDDVEIADFVCTKCSINLCVECRSQHDRLDLFKGHVVIHISNKETLQLYCETHPKMACHYFCFDCRLPICVICILKDHTAHQTSKLRDAIALRRDNLKTLLNSYGPQLDRLEAHNAKLSELTRLPPIKEPTTSVVYHSRSVANRHSSSPQAFLARPSFTNNRESISASSGVSAVSINPKFTRSLTCPAPSDFSIEANETEHKTANSEIFKLAWTNGNRTRHSMTDNMNAMCTYNSRQDDLSAEAIRAWADHSSKPQKFPGHGQFGKKVRRAKGILSGLIRDSTLVQGRLGFGNVRRSSEDDTELKGLRKLSLESMLSNDEDSEKSCDQSDESLTANIESTADEEQVKNCVTFEERAPETSDVDTSGGSDDHLSIADSHRNLYEGAAINRMCTPNGGSRKISVPRQPPDGCASTDSSSSSIEPPLPHKIMSEQIARHRRLFDLSTKTLEMSQSRKLFALYEDLLDRLKTVLDVDLPRLQDDILEIIAGETERIRSTLFNNPLVEDTASDVTVDSASMPHALRRRTGIFETQRPSPLVRPKLIWKVEKQRSDISEMFNPCDIAFLPDSMTVVAEYDNVTDKNNKLQIFDMSGKSIQVIAQGLIKPLGVALTQNGHMAVTDCKGKRVKILTLGGQTVIDIGKGQFGWPYGIAVNSRGQIIVTDAFNDTVSIYTIDGRRLKTFGSSGSQTNQFRNPYHVAVDQRDNIIVSDSGNNSVKVFNSSGKFMYFAKNAKRCMSIVDAVAPIDKKSAKRDTLTGPRGVTVDLSGNILVADDNCRVCMFDQYGVYIRNLLSEEDSVKHPEAVRCSQGGLLAVTEWNANNMCAVKMFNMYE